jgi:hypothetical protein
MREHRFPIFVLVGRTAAFADIIDGSRPASPALRDPLLDLHPFLCVMDLAFAGYCIGLEGQTLLNLRLHRVS